MKVFYLTVLTLLIAFTNLAAQEQNTVRLRDLREFSEKEVWIKGRTGNIVESEETPGIRVFTFRDDFNDLIHVRTRSDYPIMGITYHINGTPHIDPASGKLYVEEISRKPVYEPARHSSIRALYTGIIVAVILAVIALIGVVITLKRRQGASLSLPEPWGYAHIESGPDRGTTVAQRYDEILVGAEVDPLIDVHIPNDGMVSRKHGKIFRDTEGSVFYQDTASSNGSWVDEQRISGEGREPVKPDGLIRLGTKTVLKISYRSKGSEVAGTQPSEGISDRMTIVPDLNKSGMEDMSERVTRPPEQQPKKGEPAKPGGS